MWFLFERHGAVPVSRGLRFNVTNGPVYIHPTRWCCAVTSTDLSSVSLMCRHDQSSCLCSSVQRLSLLPVVISHLVILKIELRFPLTSVSLPSRWVWSPSTISRVGVGTVSLSPSVKMPNFYFYIFFWWGVRNSWNGKRDKLRKSKEALAIKVQDRRETTRLVG